MYRLFVIAGPSAIGKTYLAAQLVQRHPEQFAEVKWYTTRPPRDNEKLADRVFINEAGFLAKKERGEFFIADRFHDHWYGVKRDDLKPRTRHLLVNAWPALVTNFATLPQTVFVGLTTDHEHLELLRQRMLARGDSPQRAAERLEFIQKDIADLERVAPQIKKQGVRFFVTNDTTVPQQVIPWIEAHAILEA